MHSGERSRLTRRHAVDAFGACPSAADDVRMVVLMVLGCGSQVTMFHDNVSQARVGFVC